MTPQAYCEEKAAASGSSFYVAFRFLPQTQRDAMTALYAFCREVDDVVDECHDPDVAWKTLGWWREELKALYSAETQPSHPVMLALRPFVQRFNLPEASFRGIIEGMEMDLQLNRYNSYNDLRAYCHRVAGEVGILSAHIFGFKNPQTLEYAAKLGLALQLTNIIRDVGEDVRRSRIYLPIEDLQRFNVPAAQLLACQKSPCLKDLMNFQIQRARKVYEEALDLLPPEDKKAQRCGLVMAAIYRAVLEEIDLDGSQHVLQHKVSLPPLRKAWIALKTWWST